MDKGGIALIGKICEIFCNCYPQFKMSRDRFESLLINSNTHIIKFPDDQNPMGFAITEGAAIRLICVAPEYQNQGIGSRLLAEAEKYVSGQGFEKLYTGGVSSKFLIGADKTSAGFFEKKGFVTVGGCDEMLLKLDTFCFDESKFRGHLLADYRWYNGDIDKLKKAVAEVEEDWVKYFDAGSRVYTATVNGEIASFCLVSTDATNYLTDAFGRVGMPGCVGTVPRFRNRGIAIEMVARVTQYLKECGMDISFIFFTGVADWYKKLGYETFMTEIFMEKKLLGIIS